jgi:hypothetical protein
MADINYNQNSSWLESDNTYNDVIDYFFTSRKITNNIEKIDESNLERKIIKETKIVNFLAIHFPIENISKSLKDSNKESNIIQIEIWGDRKYHYKGNLETNSSTIPDFLIELKEDSQIFVKIISNGKNYISFIPINKRYQKENTDLNIK